MANKVQELETENKVLRDKNISNQLTALGETLQLELKNIRSEINLKLHEMQLVTSQTLEQAKKTNGRVSKTEEDIEILKLKYQELLANTININTKLDKHQTDQDVVDRDLRFFRFLAQFPKLAWLILGIIWILASNGLFKELIELIK